QVPVVAADADSGRLETQKAQIKAESQRVAAIAKQVADAKRAADTKAEKATNDAKAAEAARREAEELKLVAEATLKQADEIRRSAPPIQESVNITMVQLNLLPQTERREDWLPWVSMFPIEEQQFCKVMSKFVADMRQAESNRNEIKQNLLHKQRREDLANLIPEGDFQNWVVHAVEVRQASDGSAAVLLQLPCNVLIGSYLGSYPCNVDATNFQGTIPENSPLYREFAKFDHRDFVLVGGKLVA